MFRPITFILTILFSILFQETSFSQVIHKNELEDFVAILKTSHPDKPRDFPRDSVYIRNEPLDSMFADFFVNVSSDLLESYPKVDDDGNIYSRLSLGSDYSHFRKLEFYDRRRILVLLHNNRHEGGTYYLTSWAVAGDSLHFEKLYQKPLGVGIGSMRIDPNYRNDARGNRLFVLQKLTPDIGYDAGSYHLFQITRYGDIYELLEKTYFTAIGSPKGTEHVVIYKFLNGTDFLVQEYWYDLEQKTDSSSIHPERYLERILTDSKIELLDLRELVISEY